MSVVHLGDKDTGSRSSGKYSLARTLSFSSLIAVVSTSKTMLNSSGESGHPCLVPDLGENAFSFSPLRMTFAVCLSYMAFIMLR